MRPSIASLALVAFSFSALSPVSAQDRSAQDRSATEVARQERVEIRRQIENLASPDFEVRKRAAKKLEAYGKKARALLQKTVEESDDAEQVWQARRLLRRSDQGRPALKPRPKRPTGSKKPSGPRSKPGMRRVPGQGRSWQGFDMRGFPQFKQGESPEDFARRIQEFMKSQPFGLPGGRKGRAFQAQSHSEGTRISVGPEGVEVEISVTEDGKSRRKQYKAKSVEELLKKFPELKGKVGGFSHQVGSGSVNGGLEIEEMEREIVQMERRLRQLMKGELRHPGAGRGGPGVLRWSEEKNEDHEEDHQKSEQKSEHKADHGARSTPGKLKKMAPKGPKLGIYVGTGATAEIGRFLGLPEGVGLWVQGRTKDSLAEKLGLSQGDFLVKLAGKWIRGTDDVAKILSAQRKGQKLQAQWYRKGKRMQKSVTF